MSDTPAKLKYAATHEWVRDEGDGTVTVGITDHAQDSLGDVVYVELPEAGATVAAADEVAVVESVKAASEIYAPVDGEIVEANEALADNPAKLNESPEGDGWLYKIKLSDTSQLNDLMDLDGYKSFIA